MLMAPKIRLLIISQGGSRQDTLQRLLEGEDFEPTFQPGVPSRGLRSRASFFGYAIKAGLIPEAERAALEASGYALDSLQGIPITDRRGSPQDLSVHYSVELWRKCKSLSRERNVLACFLAHLIAMKRFVEGDYDLILEDNVRFCVGTSAERIRRAVQEADDWETKTGYKCHLRYLGWLGSQANIEWVYNHHMPKRNHGMVPFPTAKDIDPELLAVSTCNTYNKLGGTPVWGFYAYWISQDAYESVLRILRNDVGALVWKSKRMRAYKVKPVDKVIPRRVQDTLGNVFIHPPAFFRAPIESQIHKQWDERFMESTTYQLSRCGLSWDEIHLTELEKERVVTKDAIKSDHI